MEINIHIHKHYVQDETLGQLQSHLTVIEHGIRRILNQMANQEQDLKDILAAVKTVKSSLGTVTEQLAAATTRITSLEALLSDDTNQNIVDEVAELKTELGLATEAAEEATTAVENASGETTEETTEETPAEEEFTEEDAEAENPKG